MDGVFSMRLCLNLINVITWVFFKIHNTYMCVRAITLI